MNVADLCKQKNAAILCFNQYNMNSSHSGKASACQLLHCMKQANYNNTGALCPLYMDMSRMSFSAPSPPLLRSTAQQEDGRS